MTPIATAASPAKLREVLELVLSEVASLGMTNAYAAQLGTVAGGRLWQLAKDAANKARGLGYAEHYQPLTELLDVIAAAPGLAAGKPNAGPIIAACDALGRAFARAAHGLDDVGFPAKKDERTLRILVTGFDPFTGGTTQSAADWNPSAAAALALDGITIADGSLKVAVQSVILPNSQTDFDGEW